MNKLKLATSTGDFHKYTGCQFKSLSLLKECGFSYADYNFHCDYVSQSGLYGADSDGYIERIAEHTFFTGIKLVQAHAPMGDPILEDNGKFIADTVKCVKACGRWGIPNLVVHSGYDKGLSVKETMHKNKEFFLPILEAAEKYGVNILSENFNKMCIDGMFWIDNASSLLELIELVDHPLFHAVWDVGHANLQEMSQRLELAILGKHVRALHIQDNLGDYDAHLAPLLGTTNFDSVFAGLSDIGYEGYFTFEVGNFFTPYERRRPFDGENRLSKVPTSIKFEEEKYLFNLGKCMLSEYDAYAE